MDRLLNFNSMYYVLLILLLSLYMPLSLAEAPVSEEGNTATETISSEAKVNSEVTTKPATPSSITAPVTAPVTVQEPALPVEKRVQNLKKEVSRLNRDLFILEEELLFPASTQVVIFISLENGNLFNLDAVELKLNDKRIASHLYTDREISSLKKGGVQQLYIGNLPTGDHELVAFFTGKGPNGVDYRRGSTLNFEKELTTKYIELKILDNPSTQQPDFLSKQW